MALAGYAVTGTELLRSLAQPIAVVGNGAMRGMRDAIEAHRTIVRFNNFAAGHESDVGHRCDVWCVNCHPNLRYREWAGPILSVVSRQDQPADTERWARRYPQTVFAETSWIAAARAVKPTNPSTGLTLAHRLLLLNRRFACFGFDGLRSGHYWDASHRHTHPDELTALMKLAGMGVIFK